MASIKGIQAKIEATLRDMLNQKYMLELGQFASDMIRLRTQLGYGVSEDGSPRSKLKELSPAYKLQRARTKLNGNTSPSKSNLTRTGQLLSSHGVKSVSGTTVVVGPKGSRDDGKTNEQVARWVSERGRPFNFLSDTERKRLMEKIRKDLQVRLKMAMVKTK